MGFLQFLAVGLELHCPQLDSALAADDGLPQGAEAHARHLQAVFPCLDFGQPEFAQPVGCPSHDESRIVGVDCHVGKFHGGVSLPVDHLACQYTLREGREGEEQQKKEKDGCSFHSILAFDGC